MKIEVIKNKEGETLKTKQGIELKDYFLEVGDKFIPKNNSLIEDNKGKFPKFKIVAEVVDKDGNKVLNEDNEVNTEIFVTLTPTQAKNIKKKLESGVEINQHLWKAYEYESKEYGMQIGVGMQTNQKPAKSFEDFAEE